MPPYRRNDNTGAARMQENSSRQVNRYRLQRRRNRNDMSRRIHTAVEEAYGM